MRRRISIRGCVCLSGRDAFSDAVIMKTSGAMLDSIGISKIFDFQCFCQSFLSRAAQPITIGHRVGQTVRPSVCRPIGWSIFFFPLVGLSHFTIFTILSSLKVEKFKYEYFMDVYAPAQCPNHYCLCPTHYCPCLTTRNRGCRVYNFV